MTNQLRDDALQIWMCGVDAVRSERLIHQNVSVNDHQLTIGEHGWSLDQFDRIVVVGAGKAGAGMADGLEQALGPRVLEQKQVSGWINVPANCVRPLRRIHLHAARPAGRNEPTPAGSQGAEQILKLVGSLNSRDLCLCLISGGGSALLPAPIKGVSLEDKLRITRHLSASGANIQQLNAVRTALSAVKGGGLARTCRAGALVTLIISDVMGDPLSTIASGPTVIEANSAARTELALKVLDEFDVASAGVSDRIARTIRDTSQQQPPADMPRVFNLVIGNNRTATSAAEQEAARLGYDVERLPSESATTLAEQVGVSFAEAMRARASESRDMCIISGGEPVVKLIDAEHRGRGGRNQQLVLAGLINLMQQAADHRFPLNQILLSGGTDGEDGPTDAAGGLSDATVAQHMTEQHLDSIDYLKRNDAYHFLKLTDGLIHTGPTHTNVCDIRIALIRAS